MSCVAFAYATEPSLRAFSAMAALIGAATFAFTSDIAARSGSSSPASSFSSSAVSFLYSLSAMRDLLVALGDVADRLLCACGRGRVVARHGESGGEVDRRGHVGGDE